jgi:eukaryotic-like serine/threonine-protein kinase
MDPDRERWEKIKTLFDAARDLRENERETFLRSQSSDPLVNQEVEKLLRNHDEAGDFLSVALFENANRPHKALVRFSPGEVLAERFKVIQFIAAGGMGEVYEAEDLTLRERVAIKTVRQSPLTEPGLFTRLKREVLLARRVTHPNVCRIFDIFAHKQHNPDSELLLISMELLQGETLSEVLFRIKRFSEHEALPLIDQMASGLTAVHRAGIIHRDFKPGNVVLVSSPDSSGLRAVVTDFGLATRSEVSLLNSSATTESLGGELRGTLAYMAPEQLKGLPATIATDVYAFGLVMYEMVTGSRPFEGDTPLSVAVKRLSEDPVPPRQLAPQLSALWGETILKCLAKDPADRFSAIEAAAAPLIGNDSLRAVSTGRQHIEKFIVGALVVLSILAGGLYLRSRPAKTLTEKDTVVLAAFSNATGDPVFDDTLKQALTISLRQSPFLSIVSDEKVAANLKLMERPANTLLTPEVAREVCLRSDSKAYIAGSIATLGNRYVVGLRAVNCQNGETLSQEQITAGAKEAVLDSLGVLAAKLRSQLGESRATIQRFDLPLEQVTTSSLEALKAYSNADYERAIRLDPKFALAYVMADTSMLGEQIGREYLARAFQLSEHVSEREKLMIAGRYYEKVTGELDKAAKSLEELIRIYPRLEEFESATQMPRYANPYVLLGNVYQKQGRYEESLTPIRQSLQFVPNHLPPYLSLSDALFALNRFDEAKQVLEEAAARTHDSVHIHNYLYGLAFLTGDSHGVAEQAAWLGNSPQMQDMSLSTLADTAAYEGSLREASELTHRSVQLALNNGGTGMAAETLINAALRGANIRDALEAQRIATEALKLEPTGQDVQITSALVFAISGDSARAQSLARGLAKHYPLDTIVQTIWLPTIYAQLELKKNPVSAIQHLQLNRTLELGSGSWCLYSVYLRGEALLAAGQGSGAAAEFQNIIDHRGIVWNCWTGALAHIQLGRAFAMSGDAIKARAAYREFLTLWKDADPDIPILNQAKAEYEKLQ